MKRGQLYRLLDFPLDLALSSDSILESWMKMDGSVKYYAIEVYDEHEAKLITDIFCI